MCTRDATSLGDGLQLSDTKNGDPSRVPATAAPGIAPGAPAAKARRVAGSHRRGTILGNAFADLGAGLSRWRVWVALASEDIGDQHKRTTLGPLWLLINYLAFAATFIYVFHTGQTTADYRIYVATGLVVWFYIMEIISTSVTLFVREESFIKGTTLPLSVYVMRAALQSVIRAGYALVGCIAILMLGGVGVTPAWAWSVVGLLLILVTTPAVITCFAFLGVFFPDSQYVISNLMRVAMFVTPVFWSDPGAGGFRGALYHYNPFTWFLDIARTPILSGQPAFKELVLCLIVGGLMWAVAIVLLGSLRRQVALVI
jgi:lipopolysaccharide transport system permease protein